MGYVYSIASPSSLFTKLKQKHEARARAVRSPQAPNNNNNSTQQPRPKHPAVSCRQALYGRRAMSEQSSHSAEEYRILALYRFVLLAPPFDNCTDDHDKSLNDSRAEKSNPNFQPSHYPRLTELQTELYDALRPLKVRGTLLIAPEGINGTICYPFTYGNDTAHSTRDISEISGENDPVFTYLKQHTLFGGPDLRTRLSVWKDFCNEEETNTDNEFDDAEKKIQALKQPQQAFQRLKIKIKAEIVTMGLGRPLFCDGKPVQDMPKTQSVRYEENQKANPLRTKGQYLSPTQWDDQAVNDPDVLVIDTRNTYEIDIGTFDGAIDPKTKHFSEFPDYLEKLAREYDWTKHYGDESDDKEQEKTAISLQETVNNQKKKPPKAIAMFCTGGIRCEKATSYALQSNLFPKNMPIYHLEGGILAYLDHVSQEKNDNEAKNTACDNTPKSAFRGECFVFDKRVAVTSGLKPSKNYIPCYGCRGPMDRRLLLLSTNDCNSGEKRKAVQPEGEPSIIPSKYEVLMEGIPNLPALQCDPQTKSWYLPGLTCPRCHDGTTRESLERFAQRKKQMEICAREGKCHFHDGKDA